MKGQTEIWKAHPDIEKIEVSSLGRVRALDRLASSESGTYFTEGHILKQYDTAYVYLQVSIKVDGKWTMKRVNRLVAQTFIPNPDDLPQVNHKNCDRRDNRVSNLEWCTASYNIQYREKFGEAQGHPVFAINLATLEVSRYPSQIEASRILGFSVSNVNDAISGRLKQTHGYWFMEDDDKAVDLTKRKLHYIDKTRLTAADADSADFVIQVMAE